MVRVQFTVAEEKANELDALMAMTELSTKKDLLLNALAFFEWAVEEARQGRVIASMDGQRMVYKELVMPSLTNAAKKV